MTDHPPQVSSIRVLSFLVFLVWVAVIPLAKMGKIGEAVFLVPVGLLLTIALLLKWNSNSAFSRWTAPRRYVLQLLLVLFSVLVAIAIYATVVDVPTRVATTYRYVVEKLFFIFNKIQIALGLAELMTRDSYLLGIKVLACVHLLVLLVWIFRQRINSRRLLLFFSLVIFGAILGLLAPSEEFQISSSVRSAQMVFHIASDPTGNFVVVWQSKVQDSSDWGIYARRYSADGTPLGDEFRVNTHIPDNHFVPRVASDNRGNFAITWESKGQDGSSYGIYCQRYNSEGIPQGGEFQVNTTTLESQHDPFITMAPNGDFAIVWVSDTQGLAGIWGQRFSAAGHPIGGEFQVNTLAPGSKKRPSISSDNAGNFVVGWTSEGADGPGRGVYIRRYDHTGTPLGMEVQVDTSPAGPKHDIWMDMNPSGELVVIWVSDGQDGSGGGIYGRRYDASGNPFSDEFQINTFVAGDQAEPSASSDAHGNLVVTWESDGQDGSGKGVYAQRYDAGREKLGGEFQVNVYSTDLQIGPIVKYNSNGSLIFAWTSFGQDGYAEGVYGRILW